MAKDFKLLTVFIIICLTFSFIILSNILIPILADPINLAPFPDNWYSDNPWGSGVDQLNFYHDTTITHNGAYTIRIEPTNPTNTALDFFRIPVTVGEHIVLKVWVKTTGTHVGDYAGARLGIDWFTDVPQWGDIGDDQSFILSSVVRTGCSYDGYVHWGSDWTQIVWSFTVPSYIHVQDVDNYNTTYMGWHTGDHVTPKFFCPWLQIWSTQGLAGTYTSWFSDFQAYVDNSSPIPTSTSSIAPSPTPTLNPFAPTPDPFHSSSANIPFLITQQPFIINYSSGQSFTIQSTLPSSTITFTITSGLLNGTGNVNASSLGGTFQIDSTTNGTLLVTASGEPVSVYIDGAYANNIPFNFYPGDPLITWTYGSTVIINNNGIQYYFRSDTYNTLGVPGYGFDSDYTNTVSSINETYAGVEDVTYGYQVYLFNSPTIYTELTSGPSATVTVIGNYTGQINSTFNMAEHAVTLGYQGLQINVLERLGTGSWVTIANFISPVLITNAIEPSTWQFLLQIEQLQLDSANSTSAKIIFGDTNYRSGINNILFSTPNESDIQAWRIGRLDFVGFILATYLDQIGTAFYALMLLLFGGTLYFRYGHGGVVAFFFTLFGGVGGLVWVFLPLWAAGVAAAFIILLLTFTVWRIIR